MIKLILLSLAFISFARAEKTIPLRDVVSAFTWIKIAPEFPIVLTSQAEDQVSFRIFNDVYSITQQKRSYQVMKTTFSQGVKLREESVDLDAMILEKILKFSEAHQRADASLNTDLFLSSIQTKTPAEGAQVSKAIYQCKSDLPSRITRNGSVVNEILQHTWIQNGAAESFGMPNTDEAGYFGGVAHIRTPDSFIVKGPKHLECAPVLMTETDDEKKTSDRVACVARRLSLPQNPVFTEPKNEQDWIAHFDYHALDRNCLLAVRFTLECAGATAPQSVNAGIGGKLDWSAPYSVSSYSLGLKLEMQALRHRLDSLRLQDRISDLPAQADQLLNEATELDSKLRGVIGVSTPKTLREICDLALEKC